MPWVQMIKNISAAEAGETSYRRTVPGKQGAETTTSDKDH
jgi:hypothetical protein